MSVKFPEMPRQRRTYPYARILKENQDEIKYLEEKINDPMTSKSTRKIAKKARKDLLKIIKSKWFNKLLEQEALMKEYDERKYNIIDKERVKNE